MYTLPPVLLSTLFSMLQKYYSIIHDPWIYGSYYSNYFWRGGMEGRKSWPDFIWGWWRWNVGIFLIQNIFFFLILSYPPHHRFLVFYSLNSLHIFLLPMRACIIRIPASYRLIFSHLTASTTDNNRRATTQCTRGYYPFTGQERNKPLPKWCILSARS